MSPDRFKDTWDFEIYIIGDHRRSILAMENLRDICTDYLGGNCHVDVIDLRDHPEKMAEKKICVAPTLIRKYPKPEKMLVGDLSRIDKVLHGLDLDISASKTVPETYRDGLIRQGLSFKWNHLPH